uniref:Uncharacterized protein n=1 Tax=Onchocerca volvulus TaxID=6282 RepID=A0A8R1Y158_ONCVO
MGTKHGTHLLVELSSVGPYVIHAWRISRIREHNVLSVLSETLNGKRKYLTGRKQKELLKVDNVSEAKSITMEVGGEWVDGWVGR